MLADNQLKQFMILQIDHGSQKHKQGAAQGEGAPDGVPEGQELQGEEETPVEKR